VPFSRRLEKRSSAKRDVRNGSTAPHFGIAANHISTGVVQSCRAISNLGQKRAILISLSNWRPIMKDNELTEQTRQPSTTILETSTGSPATSLAGRGDSPGLTTRQYARLLNQWVASIGLHPLKFGMHSLRRTKATLIYRRTGNLRAVQLLLGHTKIESTVRYLGIEIDDAIEIAEKIEV
jgi:integrase